MKKILVTGAAGFIGFHLALSLQKRGDSVVGVDNFNHYYDPTLKRKREAILRKEGIGVIERDICDQTGLDLLFKTHEFTHCAHLAAQAGVRHSLHAPQDYIHSNVEGFVSILEACRKYRVKLTYASSSSVYGLNQKVPFSVEDRTDQPANLYGATKKTNELLAFSYHHLYGLAVTGLRYFTVYGPWGRPDMAYYRFTQLIDEGKPIEVFNHGAMSRDFTYIEDIIRGTLAAIDLESSCALFNLGGHRPVQLIYLIEQIEHYLGKKAIRVMKPMQPGEVLQTYADITQSQQLLGYSPTVSIEEGIERFINWYTDSN